MKQKLTTEEKDKKNKRKSSKNINCENFIKIDEKMNKNN